ncbi:hypothetical protein C8Q79DRAFT_33157 [Trametes meyenii]|nr:hypothetical protein C8Q79DRAFT_33157 [Trametes meyenii]
MCLEAGMVAFACVGHYTSSRTRDASKGLSRWALSIYLPSPNHGWRKRTRKRGGGVHNARRPTGILILTRTGTGTRTRTGTTPTARPAARSTQPAPLRGGPRGGQPRRCILCANAQKPRFIMPGASCFARRTSVPLPHPCTRGGGGAHARPMLRPLDVRAARARFATSARPLACSIATAYKDPLSIGNELSRTAIWETCVLDLSCARAVGLE